MIRWYIADRQRGKTEDLITWVKQGKKTKTYPYWTRIIIEPNMATADQLRGGDPATNKYGLDYQQVFSWEEWRGVYRGARSYLDIEIGIDNVDILLGDLLQGWGQIARATATGDISAWPEVIDQQLEEDK